MDDNPLKLAGDGPDPEGGSALAEFVKARLGAAASAYWTALRPNLGVPWHDCYSKSLGLLCELLAERDDLVDSISRTSEEETGLMEGQNKELRKHPLYTRLNQAEAQVHTLMTRFGMNPAAIKKIKGTKDDGGSKPLNALLG